MNNFPEPTPEMLTTPEFEAIWQSIKSWDINVPEQYSGYMGATGNHVRAILDALRSAGCLKGDRLGSPNPTVRELAAKHKLQVKESSDTIDSITGKRISSDE